MHSIYCLLVQGFCPAVAQVGICFLHLPSARTPLLGLSRSLQGLCELSGAAHSERAGITSVPSHTPGTCTGRIVQGKGASLPPTQSAFDWNYPDELTSNPVRILAQDHSQWSCTGLPRCCRVLQLCAKAFPCPSPTQALPQQCHLSLTPEATENFCIHLGDPPWWFV